MCCSIDPAKNLGKPNKITGWGFTIIGCSLQNLLNSQCFITTLFHRNNNYNYFWANSAIIALAAIVLHWYPYTFWAVIFNRWGIAKIFKAHHFSFFMIFEIKCHSPSDYFLNVEIAGWGGRQPGGRLISPPTPTRAMNRFRRQNMGNFLPQHIPSSNTDHSW